MTISPLFQTFVSDYPKWKFWQAGQDLYVLAYGWLSQDSTKGSPEFPNYQGSPNIGAYAYLPVPIVSNVFYNGSVLTFHMEGNLWVCNGLTGTISQKRV